MRVAMFVTGFPIPSETFILDQIVGLSRRGCDITIFADLEVEARGTESELTLPAACRWPKLRWQSLNALRSLNVLRYGRRAASLRMFFEALRCMDHAPFDVVHCHFGPNGIRAAALREIGAIRSRALVTSFYGYDVSEFIRGQNPYSRLFRQGELFLPLSEKMRDRLIAIGCPAERTVVHRLGVTSGNFPASVLRGSPGPVRIVSIARLVEKKGIEYGIQAVARVVEAAPCAVQYTIIGDGHLRPALEESIRRLGLQEVVVVAGWQDRAAVRQYLADADMLLAPSVTSATGDEEGTPTAILEAMASGLPVISTFHAGIPELVKDGVSGILVRERDIEGAANAMVRLVRDEGLRRTMGASGRTLVSESHDVERLNDELLEIYGSLV